MTASAIRFDPQFKRTGHTQWFVDGYSKLRIAVCPNIVIINDNQCCHKDDIKCDAYKGIIKSHSEFYFLFQKSDIHKTWHHKRRK